MIGVDMSIPIWMFWVVSGLVTVVFTLPPIIAGTLPVRKTSRNSKVRGVCVGLVIGLLAFMVSIPGGVPGGMAFYDSTFFVLFLALLIAATYYVRRRSGRVQSADLNHEDAPGPVP